MNALAVALATLTMAGGGVLAHDAVSTPPSNDSMPATARVSDMSFGGPGADQRGHGRFGGRGQGGQRGQGGRGGQHQELRQELQRRTMDELGITPQDMIDARRKAIQSMVDDDLIPQQRAQRMLQRLDEAAECLEQSSDPRECRPHRNEGGSFGGGEPAGDSQMPI